MNRTIRRRMMTVPATAYKQSPPDSTHVTHDIEEIYFLCYVADATKVVMSKRGREEVSSMLLYVHGDDLVKLSPNDKITCRHKIRQEPLKIDRWDMPGGEAEIGIVYLQ